VDLPADAIKKFCFTVACFASASGLILQIRRHVAQMQIAADRIAAFNL
jgi:hypothetical protein